jgi:hypothetical protein
MKIIKNKNHQHFIIRLLVFVLLANPFFSYTLGANADGIDSDTKLMLHMDGANLSTTFTDSSLSPHTVNNFGDPDIRTAISKFGGASGYFDGNDHITVDDSDDWYTPGEYTVDTWIRFNSLPVSGFGIVGQREAHNNQILQLYYYGGILYTWYDAAGVASYNWAGGSTVPAVQLNTWYHIVSERYFDGSDYHWCLFIDGTKVADTVNNVITPANKVGPLDIGNFATYPMNGYLDELRFSKDIARYSCTSFTPETEPYSGAATPSSNGAVDFRYGPPGPLDGEIDEVADDGYATTSVYWTATGNYQSGDTVKVTIAPTPSSTANLQPCTPASTTAFGASGSFGSATPGTITWTFSANATELDGGLCLRIPLEDGGEVSTKNYSFAAVTQGSVINWGAIMFYVYSGNDVFVTGNVQPTLEFTITEPNDVASELANHTCDLGSIVNGIVSECSYRLRISTNASLGFTVRVNTDGGLSNQGYATITDVIDNQNVNTAGTEAYGVMVEAAAQGGYDSTTGDYDLPMTEAGTFAIDDTPLTTYTQPLFVSFYDGFSGTDSNSTSLVTHRAMATAATPVGIYDQLVTYTITTDF